MAINKEIGNFGEDAAAKFLEDKGYRIIKKNFYCRGGEIDKIATDGDATVFVEVKTRKSADFGRAAEFVNWHKQQKVIKTALYYVGESSTPMRFDVVEVYYKDAGDTRQITKIEHIENAFC